MKRTRSSLQISRLLAILVVGALLGVSTASFSPAQPVMAQTVNVCAQPHQDVALPLTELGNQVYIRIDGQDTGFRGGLYPHGSNLRPPAHEAAGVALARQIRPLDANGNPDAVNGKIGMISIGMSNTFMDFRDFIRAAVVDPNYNPKLELTNGAYAGAVSSFWLDPNSENWQEVDRRLLNEGLTPAQVQTAWIKLTQTGPGDFPAKAQSLESELRIIMRNLKSNYPNVKIAYLSSRTRSYFLWGGLSPEPAAYETGFAVKWMIEGQINGDADLNYDPNRGPVVAPYLTWGPYLWIDGLNPRADGRIWAPTDLIRDCTHPTASGVAKVVDMMLEFFRSDSTTGWFWNGAPLIELRFYFPYVVGIPGPGGWAFQVNPFPP